MNVQEKKIELAKRILETDNPVVLQKVEDVFASKEYPLNEEQLRLEIELGIKQLDAGQSIAWEDFKEKYFKSK